MQKKSDDFSIQEAMRLAQSETGQQLLALLRTQNSGLFQQAAAQSQAGDYEQAKKTLAAFLSSPQAQELLKKLGR